MNIKIISQYFHPDNFKINEISQELVLLGNDVTILTGLPDYTTSKVPKEYKRGKKKKDVFFGAKVTRVPIIARRKGIVFRVLNYLSFIITSSIHALFSKKEHIDKLFVYQTSPVFQAIPAIIYKHRYQKPLVLYCCDLWPESLKAWNVKESSFVYKATKKVSQYIYSKCDIIAVTSKPFEDYLNNVCLIPRERIIYLPQHAEDEFKSVVGKYEDNKEINFTFAGNIGSVQNLESVIKAVKEVSSKKPFKLHIVGDGSELENLKTISKKLKLNDKIEFHGRYPLNEMKRFYEKADCLLLTLRGGDFIGKTLPGKTQTYLSTGKPILGAIGGAGYDLINEIDCGIAVQPDDIKGIAKAMDEIIENLDLYKNKGISGRKYYEENFTTEVFIKRLINIFESLD